MVEYVRTLKLLWVITYLEVAMGDYVPKGCYGKYVPRGCYW